MAEPSPFLLLCQSTLPTDHVQASGPLPGRRSRQTARSRNEIAALTGLSVAAYVASVAWKGLAFQGQRLDTPHKRLGHITDADRGNCVERGGCGGPTHATRSECMTKP